MKIWTTLTCTFIFMVLFTAGLVYEIKRTQDRDKKPVLSIEHNLFHVEDGNTPVATSILDPSKLTTEYKGITIELGDANKNSIMRLYNYKGELLVDLNNTGIIYGRAYRPSKTAKDFWTTLKAAYPKVCDIEPMHVTISNIECNNGTLDKDVDKDKPVIPSSDAPQIYWEKH